MRPGWKSLCGIMQQSAPVSEIPPAKCKYCGNGIWWRVFASKHGERWISYQRKDKSKRWLEPHDCRKKGASNAPQA